MAKVIYFNKPFDVMCQFTDSSGRVTLANYLSKSDAVGCYPAGRLDKDSEGLVILTDDGAYQHELSHPKHKSPKVYWVQVEGKITDQALEFLAEGVVLKDGMTKKAKVKAIEQPDIWARVPAIRERKKIPTSWIELTLYEGKNRQVRRMTAAVGFPTLRLVRFAIGSVNLANLVADTTEQVLAPGCSVLRHLNIKLNKENRRRNHRTKTVGGDIKKNVPKKQGSKNKDYDG